MQDKEKAKAIAKQLIELTSEFSDKHLDDEYKQLSTRLIEKMGRKRNVPFLTGKPEIWAAAVIHALGTINFLFDRNTQPYATNDDISNFFGAAKSTITQKSKVIRDMFKLHHFDPDFSIQSVKEDDPFADLVMINGFIVPKKSLPQEIQEQIDMELDKQKKRR